MTFKRLLLGTCCGLIGLSMTLHVEPTAADPLSQLADPTRPPGAFRKAPSGQPGLVGSAASEGLAASGQAGADAPDTTPLPKLQSIHRDTRTGRANALLDAEIRQVGERSGGWTVLAIDPDSVVLRGPSGTVRLSLMGGHEKLKQWRGPSTPTPRKDQP